MNLFDHTSPAVRDALEAALDGRELSANAARPLLATTGRDLAALGAVADELRRRQVGDGVTYVVNRNINFTNVCIKHCGFCAFSRGHRTEEAYFLSVDEVVRRVIEAVELGATEVCLQAGLPPKLDGRYYIDLCAAVHRAAPGVHIHAFSPEEVLYGATRAELSVEEYLIALREAGLGTLPGTSAEILDETIRDQISPGRISTQNWISVVSTAHRLGIRTTATMMYGHVESASDQLAHLLLLRELQQQFGGFTEIVPLSFIHQEAPMWIISRQGVRPGPTGSEVLRVIALRRILLGSTFRNVQASWVKDGLKLAQLLLYHGANDLGGTLINESISTSAGALSVSASRRGSCAARSAKRDVIRSNARRSTRDAMRVTPILSTRSPSRIHVLARTASSSAPTCIAIVDRVPLIQNEIPPHL